MKKMMIFLLAFLTFGCQNTSLSKTGDASNADSSKMVSTTVGKISILKSFYKETQEKMDTMDYGGFFANGYTEYGDGTMPPKVYATPDSLVIGYKQLCKIVPNNVAFDEEYFSGDSGKILVLATFTGTWNGIEVNGQKATNKSYKYKDADIWTLDANGKITSHRNVYPASAIYEQVGFIAHKK